MNAISHPMRLGGAICDLVTPFRDGRLDVAGLAALVDWQISQDISAILVCGQAGEATALTREERTLVVQTALAASAGRVPILVGTGTTATATTVALTAEARALGADAAVIVTPYYSRPSQAGIFEHFQQIAAAVDLPIIVCNAPACTASDVAVRTLERLSSIPQIVGLQDCTGDISRLVCAPAAIRKRLRLYAGHDLTALAFILAGGAGVISQAANLVPRCVAALHAAVATGNIDTALALGERLNPVLQILAREPGPSAIKKALAMQGRIDPEVRLPLLPVTPEVTGALRMALASLPGEPAPQARAV